MALSSNEKIKRARAWGEAHGYYGMLGGWIAHSKRRGYVCHGWEKLYDRHAQEIEYWHNHRDGFSTGDPVWYFCQGAYLEAVIVAFTARRVVIAVSKDQGQVNRQIVRVVAPYSLTVRVPPLKSV